jgi:hypothetical protein
LLSSLETKQLDVVRDFPRPSVVEFMERKLSSELQFVADGIQIRNKTMRSIAGQGGYLRQLQKQPERRSQAQTSTWVDVEIAIARDLVIQLFHDGESGRKLFWHCNPKSVCVRNLRVIGSRRGELKLTFQEDLPTRNRKQGHPWIAL